MRIGLLLDGRMQEGWVREALSRALAVPGVGLGAIAILHGIAPRRGAGLFAVVDRVDRALRCRGEPLFARRDTVAGLDAPRLAVNAQTCRDAWTLDAPDARRLASLGVDVWLCVTQKPACRPLPAISRSGVWSLEIGGATPAARPWAGAAEIAAGSRITMTAVADWMAREGTSLYRSYGATFGSSPRRNRLRALQKGLRLFARLLDAYSREGESAWPPQPPERPAARVPRRFAPTPAAVTRLCGRIAANVAANRWSRLRFREQWRIAYCFFDDAARDGAASGWRHLVPPAGRHWADPFVAEHEGRHVVFFEDVSGDHDRGRILAAELFRDAEPGPPVVVLERPYHLSYPFVFRWNGALWMLPETGANRSVELYRCEEFPARWTLDRVLLDGVAAYDATLAPVGGRWWMFVNVAEPGADCNDELHLYSSDTPLGPWVAHRANPVVTDVRSARSAGPLMVQDGCLFRPSQDSSRVYGEAISINRVDRLDEVAYRETPVARIHPGRGDGVRCIHTVGSEGRVGVVDFMLRRPRW